MKQISVKKYDSSYFENNYSFNYLRKVRLQDYGDVPKRLAELLPLKKVDTVIDYGCGVGSLVFYLALRFKCTTIGIDYSKDAIKICNKYKKKIIKNNGIDPKKTVFLNKKIAELPTYKNIKAIYLQDVIEHLYDEEINKMLQKFKTWNQNGIFLILHTDNNLYLKFIRPFEDFVSILLKKTTREKLKIRNEYENDRHINLMTVNQVKRKLQKQGFRTIKVEYSTISYEKIQAQLKKSWRIKPILHVIYYIAKVLFFLTPSFYILAKYDKKDILSK